MSGARAFEKLGCAACHLSDGSGRGPSVLGLAGRTVRLVGGGSAVADRDYLRESILRPAARVVVGYEPLMPSYQGLLSEEDADGLVSYLETLGGPREAR